MIPGTVNCPSTWTREYYGYIMSEFVSHFRTMYECVDVNVEAVANTAVDTDGVLFYFNEVRCQGGQGLSCPPYVEGDVVLCVVCTK